MKDAEFSEGGIFREVNFQWGEFSGGEFSKGGIFRGRVFRWESFPRTHHKLSICLKPAGINFSCFYDRKQCQQSVFYSQHFLDISKHKKFHQCKISHLVQNTGNNYHWKKYRKKNHGTFQKILRSNATSKNVMAHPDRAENRCFHCNFLKSKHAICDCCIRKNRNCTFTSRKWKISIKIALLRSLWMRHRKEVWRRTRFMTEC